MKNNYTPKIRFPRFTEDWEQHKLGEISEKVTEKNKNNIYSETLTNSAEFGIINQHDFFNKDISNEKNLGGYYVVRPDDFVYNPRISTLAPVGPIKRNKLGRTGVMSPLYYVFRTHDIDKTYLEKYFSSNSWHTFMKLNGDSGARSDRFAIKDSLFREMPIPIPSIEEQTKIGNFFEQLEDTIVLYQQKLTILKQTKQGFLQKMFPKAGEKVPEVRFPGFTNNWEQRKLDKILKERKVKQKISKELPLLAFAAGQGVIDRSERKTNNRDFLTKDSTKKTYLLTKYDDIVYNPSNLKYGAIDRNKHGQGVISPIYVTFETDEVPSFIELIVKSENFKQRALQYEEGTVTKRQSVKPENLLCLNVVMPSSKDEQTKIGNFFKQLDDTITLQQRELDALKETKKAFLQKMFT